MLPIYLDIMTLRNSYILPPSHLPPEIYPKELMKIQKMENYGKYKRGFSIAVVLVRVGNNWK